MSAYKLLRYHVIRFISYSQCHALYDPISEFSLFIWCLLCSIHSVDLDGFYLQVKLLS